MRFWKENSSSISRLIINQVGIVIFSIVLNMAVARAWGAQYLIWVSLFATVFYLYLVYTVMWEQGSKDIIRMESGRLPTDKKRGLKISLCASAPNAVLWLLMFIGACIFTVTPAFFNNAGVFTAFVWQGMYYGAVYAVAGNATGLLKPWLMVLCYFVAMLLLPLISHFGYRMGMKNWKLFGNKKTDTKK